MEAWKNYLLVAKNLSHLDATIYSLLGSSSACLGVGTTVARNVYSDVSREFQRLRQKKGKIPIGDLRLGDNVLTYTPEKGAHYTEVKENR